MAPEAFSPLIFGLSEEAAQCFATRPSKCIARIHGKREKSMQENVGLRACVRRMQKGDPGVLRRSMSPKMPIIIEN